MKKKNENIFLHIIEQDYKEAERSHSERLDISGKVIPLDELEKKDASVLESLRKMHTDSGSIEQPESLEVPEETKLVEEPSAIDRANLPDVSELITEYQEMKTSEQALEDRRQDLLSIQKDLRGKLVGEISKKKKSIQGLQKEISVLETSCRELSEELGLSINI